MMPALASRLHSETVMHCPECHTLNETEAAACLSCGLILLKAAPKRRAEDQARQARRSSDQDSATCKFCGGDIPANAIRCRHCAEIVNDEYFRERAQRFRSRINYSSWVAYLFGLAALVVFRPVGVLSIAAGLLLSILYYAIPVEPPASPSSKKRTRLGTLIRRQLRLERVAIPLPAFRQKKLVFVGTPLVAALIGYSANLFLLQEPVNEVLKQNAAFQGMEVSAHYQYWIVPGVVVYDLKGVSLRQTPIDVHTAFLEFAKKVKAKRYQRVELSYQGTTKFSINGAAFAKLGDEYSKRNFDYVLYSFARLFQPENGTQPLDSAISDRDALLEFHRQWYGKDTFTVPVANAMR
jgi:hypothetical protein